MYHIIQLYSAHVHLHFQPLTAEQSPEEKKQQPLDNHSVPENQTSEEDLQLAQSASGRDVTVSQSTSSSNNGFEIVKPNSASDTSVEMD